MNKKDFMKKELEKRINELSKRINELEMCHIDTKSHNEYLLNKDMEISKIEDEENQLMRENSINNE